MPGFGSGQRPKIGFARVNAYQQVAEELRRQVLKGDLPPGHRLPPERVIANDLGVSRVVVREAIRTLEGAGILEVKRGAGGGIFVSRSYDKPISDTIANLLGGGDITLEHLFELRLLLEPPAVAKVARTAGKAELKSLAELLQMAEDAKDQAGELRRLNLDFHRRLAQLSGNPLWAALCDTVLAILVKSIQHTASVETSLNVLAWHRRILAALCQGEAQEAERLIKEDLKELWNRYRRLVEDREAQGAAAAG